MLRSRSSRIFDVASRALVVVSTLLAAFAPCGCATVKQVKLPQVVGDNPTTAELVDAINGNSAKIRSIYAPDASIGVKGQPGWAKCRFLFEREDKLRLVGTASLVGRVVDCGCDGEKFWFWSSFQNADELYYCRLDQYHESALVNLVPVDPSWFPEAFGVVDLKVEDVVEDAIVQSDDSILLVVKKTRPDGVYRKKMYIEAKSAAIKRQEVINPSGATILVVECREPQYDKEYGVVLPKKLEIKSLTAGGELTVDLGTPTLNDESKIQASAFQMPSDLNATAVDLGAGASKASNAKTSAPQPSPSPAAQPAPTSGVASNATAPVRSATNQGVGIVAFPTTDQGRWSAAPDDARNRTVASRPGVVLDSQTIASTNGRAVAVAANFGAPASESAAPLIPNESGDALPTATVRTIVYDGASNLRRESSAPTSEPTNAIVESVVSTPLTAQRATLDVDVARNSQPNSTFVSNAPSFRSAQPVETPSAPAPSAANTFVDAAAANLTALGQETAPFDGESAPPELPAPVDATNVDDEFPILPTF